MAKEKGTVNIPIDDYNNLITIRDSLRNKNSLVFRRGLYGFSSIYYAEDKEIFMEMSAINSNLSDEIQKIKDKTIFGLIWMRICGEI